MDFWIPLTILVAALAADTVHAQEDAIPPKQMVKFESVVSPETFTLVENLAWGARTILYPEKFENTVVMYGYGPKDVCNDKIKFSDATAAIAVSLSQGTASPPYKIAFYETVDNACNGEFMSVKGDRGADRATIEAFASVIAMIAEEDKGLTELLVVSTGRLPVDEKGLEIWAFCSGDTFCLGRDTAR